MKKVEEKRRVSLLDCLKADYEGCHLGKWKMGDDVRTLYVEAKSFYEKYVKNLPDTITDYGGAGLALTNLFYKQTDSVFAGRGEDDYGLGIKFNTYEYTRTLVADLVVEPFEVFCENLERSSSCWKHRVGLSLDAAVGKTVVKLFYRQGWKAYIKLTPENFYNNQAATIEPDESDDLLRPLLRGLDVKNVPNFEMARAMLEGIGYKLGKEWVE